MSDFKGLTWDHPRGYRPLQAWAQADNRVSVEWDIQKLEGFESHPIDELAQKYELLIVDNPGIGEAAEKHCLRPLEDFLTPEQMDFLRQTSTGASFESYQYAGQHWAVPIDAASQVCAWVEGMFDAPASWQDVARLSQAFPGQVALSLGGPHALLTFYSISQSLGGTLFEGDNLVLDEGIAVAALELMQAIFRHQALALIEHNPIGLLDAMAEGAFALCPAIFGYVNYSTPQRGRTVCFVDIPHGGNPLLRGSVLGGTGLAVSVHCQPTPELIAHIMDYVSISVQTGLVVESGGQPANAAAWLDAQANTLTNGFFANTFATVSGAYVRPKYHGYILFQDSSSAIIRTGLKQGDEAAKIYADIVANHARLVD